MSSARIAVADGRAVASSGDDLRVELLSSMLRSLERHGYDVVIVVDDDLQVRIARSGKTDVLEEAIIQQIPAGTDPVQLILSIADDAGATVVSNESFEAYRAAYPWIAERRMPYRVFQDEIYLDPEDLMGVF